MTLLQLEIFLMILETKSFTKAAERLNMSQSAVSHSLHGLESELGVSLFQRGKRGVQITEAGSSFLPHVREIMSQIRIMEQKALSMTNLESGIVKIGCFPSFTANVLPDLLVGFHQKYPGIRCEVSEGDYNDVATWVKEATVDIGFSIHPQQELIFQPLFQDAIHVIMSDTHTWRDLSSIPVGELAGEPYINVRGYEQLLEEIMKNQSSGLNVKFNLNNTYSIISIIQAGLGITMLPQLAIPKNTSGIHTVPLNPAFYRTVGLLSRPVPTLTPAAGAFLDFTLKEAANDDVKKAAKALAAVKSVKLGIMDG